MGCSPRAISSIWHRTFGYSGRLGNQLWQIAGMVAIGERTGHDVALPADWTYRPWFSIPTTVYDDPGPDPLIAESSVWVSHLRHGARPYLQDMTLWTAATAPTLRAWLRPSEDAAGDFRMVAMRLAFDSLPQPVLGMHVRRGDNASNPNDNHPLRPSAYYRDALELAAGDFASLAIFTDDPQWCVTAANPGGELGVPDHLRSFVFCSGARPKEHDPAYRNPDYATDWLDLHLMARCDGHIIANSSFGWWGAWLAARDVVVYPKPWYGPGLFDIMEEWRILPETWTAVPS